MRKETPFWQKSNLTIDEAAVYFSIGEQKLRALCAREDCPFVLMLQLITPCCIMDVAQVGEAFRLSVSVYTNLTPICCRVA